MLPLFKKTHISSRAILDFVQTGRITEYSEEPNKRNALRQAGALYRVVEGELYRHGSDREYQKYGLRTVIHDNEPERKREIIEAGHIDPVGHHLGMNTTIKNVSESFYWQGISAHVKVYLKNCEMCKVRSKLDAEQWVETERQNLFKKSEKKISTEAKTELKNLGRIRKPTPPETFFVVNAKRKVDFESLHGDPEMLIDSNNIEFVIETLGYSEDGVELDEVYHVLNVPDIVPVVDRCRSREIEAFLKHGTYPDDFTVNQRSGLRGPAAQYCIIEGELYHEGNKAGSKGLRSVIHDDKPALKVKLMVESHLDKDGSHNGLNKTMNKIGEKYFWIGMSIDVRKFLLNCKICNTGRGKRIKEDTQKYRQEVQRLKQRQSVGTAQQETITMYSQETGEQITTTSDAYNQIIQLVGPNEENITEITVAVVDGEFVPQKIEEHHANIDIDVEETGTAADNIGVKSSVASTVTEYMQESSSNAGSSIEVANSGAVMVRGGKQNKETLKIGEVDEGQGRLTVAYEETEEGESAVVEAEVLRMILKQELGDDDSGEVGTNEDEANSTNDYTEGVHEQGISSGETSEGNVSNSNLATEKCDKTSGSTEVDQLIADDGRHVTILMKPVEAGMQNVTGFYKDVIHVPRLMKTRAIELYLKEGKVMPMYSSQKLKEVAQYYELVDDMIFRRPSPYKARQILIHDDQPELKWNIIEEMHIKPTGGHNSELITGKNLTYKYFWDEVFWDIYRYYSRCPVCVEDGKNIKTGKPVLTMEEKRRRLREKKHKDGDASRARDYRLQQTIRLARMRLQQRYAATDGMDNVLDEHAEYMDERDEELEEALDGTVVSKIEATSEDEMEGWDEEPADAAMVKMEVLQDASSDESDIEISMPESDGDDSVAARDDSMATVDDSMATVDDRCIGGDESDIEISMPESDVDNSVVARDDSMATVEDSSAVSEPGSCVVDAVLSQNLEEYDKSTADADAVAGTVEVIDEASVVEDVSDMEGTPEADTQPRRSRRRAELTSEGSGLNDTKTPPDGDKERKNRGTKRQMEKVSLPVREESRPRREIKRPRRFSPETVQKKSSSKMDTEQTKIKMEKTQKSSEKIAIKPDGSKDRDKKSLTGKCASPQKKGKKSISNEVPQVSPKKRISSQSKDMKDTESAASISNPAHESSLQHKVVKIVTTSIEQSDIEELETGNNGAAVNTEEEMAEINDVKSIEGHEDEETVEENPLSTSIDVAPENVEEFSNYMMDSIGEKMEDDGDSEDDLEDIDGDEDGDDDDDLEDTDDDEEDVGPNPALNILLEDHNMEKIEAVKVSDGYMCSLCDQKFTTEQKCTNHCQKSACVDTCELCGKLFRKTTEMAEFDNHKSLHKSEKHCCEICKKEFFDAHHLRVHQRSHASDMCEQCALCEFACYTSFQLASHMLQEHGEAHVFTCDVCRAKFVNINFMKPQLCVDGQMSYFKCVMCS